MQYQPVWGSNYHRLNEYQRHRSDNYAALRDSVAELLLLAAIPPLAFFVGATYFGWSLAEDVFIRLTPSSALPMAIGFYLTLILGCGLITTLIHWLACRDGKSVAIENCLALTLHTVKPMLLAGLGGLVPLLWFDVLIAMAAIGGSIYRLFEGTPRFMNLSQDRAFFFSFLLVCIALVMLVAILALTTILWGTSLSPVVDSTLFWDMGLL